MNKPVKVGIGALIKGEPCNAIRALETTIAYATDHWRGLDQPPHITVKRPFTIHNQTEMDRVVAIFDDIAAQSQPFTMQYEGIGRFNSKVLFLKVLPSEQLDELHTRSVNAMLQLSTDTKLATELTSDMIFHTTLSLDLDETNFEKAQQCLEDFNITGLKEDIPIASLGLFHQHRRRPLEYSP